MHLSSLVIIPLVLFGLPMTAFAQESPVVPAAENPAKGALPERSMTYRGKKFTLGRVHRAKTYALNAYYPEGQSQDKWVQMLSLAAHPAQTDIKVVKKNMTGYYEKKGHEVVASKLNTPRVIGFYVYEKYPKLHQLTIHALNYGANNKGVFVRTYTTRYLPKEEEAFRKQSEKLRGDYLSKLALAKFPKFVIGKAPSGVEDKPASKPAAEPLKTIPEKVTNIKGKGGLYTIDDEFAKKHGATPPTHRPFHITVPKPPKGKATVATRPKVKEAIRFTQVVDGKLHESVRLTGLTIPTGKPMAERLQTAAALIEKQSVPAFFKGHKDGSIGMRYRTKIGPYDGACLLGRFTAEDGTIFYIKFVAILEEDNPKGLMAVMLLNPTGDKPMNIKKRMQDGFAQQVLHSVRFKK